MKLTNIGGATAILEHRGKRILFDPRLDDGIFHGAWYHWPPLAMKLEDLGRFDYVYISHIHEDHCSAGTIRYLNRDAQIILMDRQPNFVANFLAANRFEFAKVHLVRPREEVEIEPGLFVNMIEPDPSNEMAYMIDSSLVIRWDDFVVFNANDCQPHEAGLAYLKNRYPNVDLALLPYSGGSGYPSCYVNLTHEEKCAERERILASRLVSFQRALKTIRPKYVMPFADQYVVAGSRAGLNRYITHGSSPGIVREGLADGDDLGRLVLLNSGQSFDFGSGRRQPDEEFRFYTEADREAYIAASLREIQYEHEQVSLSSGVALERIVNYARARLWGMQEKRSEFPQFSIYLDFADSGRRFRLRLDQRNVLAETGDSPIVEPFLRVSAPDSLMIMLLIGHVSWNIADAALFLDYERRPNVYDPSIYVLLNFLKA